MKSDIEQICFRNNFESIMNNSQDSTEIAVIDELGNTVGMLLSTTQTCSTALEPSRPSTIRYPVPCSKQTSITTQWLKENFVENGFTSVARSIMFEEYINYCCDKNTKPFNQAVFGKVVRACFPNLATRRLGVRGQSRYHYAGLSVKPTSIYAERLQCNSERFGLARFNNGAHSRDRDATSHVTVRQPISKVCKSKYRYGLAKVILPPYPTGVDISPQPYWSTEQMTLFLHFYRSYNKQMLTFLISLHFEKTFGHVSNFVNFVPEKCRPLLRSPMLCNILAVCDDILYQEANEALIPDCLATLKSEFSVTLRKLAKVLPSWIGDESKRGSLACKEVVSCRVQSAKLWGDHVRRVTTLCHVAKEARKTLTYPSIVIPLLNDLNNICIRDISEQCSFSGKRVVDDDVTPEHEHAQRYMKRFRDLLKDQVSVEFYAHELERLVEKHAGLKETYSGEIITDRTRQFMMKWAVYGSKILTEITLRSSESVGPFHLVMLLFGDYVNHVITLKSEHARRIRRLRSVIRSDSTYFTRSWATSSGQKLNEQSLPDVPPYFTVFADSSVSRYPSRPEATPLHRISSFPSVINPHVQSEGAVKRAKLATQVAGVVASMERKQPHSIVFQQPLGGAHSRASFYVLSSPTAASSANLLLE